VTGGLKEKPGNDVFSRMRAAGLLNDKPKIAAAPPVWMHDTAIDDKQKQAYAKAAIDSACRNIAGAVEGTRNDTLNRESFSIGRIVEAGWLSGDYVLRRLATAAQLAGLPANEIGSVVGRAVGDGGKKLEAPHLVDRDDIPAVTTLDSLDEQATEQVADADEMQATALIDDIIVPEVDWHAEWAKEIDEDWIVEPIIAAGRGTSFYAPPKLGKSLLMLELAASVAAGREVFGQPSSRRHVLYVDFENTLHGDIIPRLQDMQFTPDDVTGHLHYLSLPSLETLDTLEGGLRLLRNAQHYDADVVIIDTVSRAVAGEENSNDTWLAFYRHTGLPLKQNGIGYVRIDHTGKDESRGARGGSAKNGDVDLVWQLTKGPSADTFLLRCDAKRMPISDDEITVTRQTSPLRHVAAFDNVAAWLGRIGAIVDKLDALGVPPNAGWRPCGQALRDAGIRASNKDIREAAARRKEGGHVTTIDL
jgi:plasmid stabilization system protein ParE